MFDPPDDRSAGSDGTAREPSIRPLAAAPDPVAGAGLDALTPDPVSAAPRIDRLPFDGALGELQTVVGRLETGGLPLEESIALYERGVALHDHCARLLSGAELRVQRLVEQAGGSLRALDFDPDEADA